MDSNLESIDRLLTNRQRQVCHLVCTRGLSNKAVGNIMKITEATVKYHMASIFRAFCVRNRTQLIICWNRYNQPEPALA